jgi:quinoprotein glucose dehydrogenase
MPIRLSEGADAAPGDIRAFDVRTGKLVWTFHTIPHPDEFGYDTWATDNYKNTNVGGANNWAGMAVDNNLEIIYIPTGSAAPDFYGGHRKGSNLFSDCLLALDANTGQLKWYFQFTHHDIWDRDLPAPPNLINVTRKGKKIPAVAQITKQGYVYVFNRKTGKPLFEIEEVKVPTSNLKGEAAWITQPIPKSPKPFARQAQDFTEDDISPYAENRKELIKILKSSDRRLYAPPSTTPVFLLPGYDGGGEWGGAAADPQEGILYVNSNEMAWLLQMEEDTTVQNLSKGQALYLQNCASCHQKDLKGNQASGYPALVNISNTLKKEETLQLINTGKGMMPGYPHLSTIEKNAIADFIYQEEKKEVKDDFAVKNLLPYRHTGYHKFLDNQGLPAIAPPWGTLNAIDLNTGKYLWTVPLGETESLKTKGYPTTGTENYGGAVVTQNGLLFIAATKDEYFRAFDKRTGQILFETKLPAASFATPATYQVNGKQYIVMACGGEKLGTPKGNKVIAFALE